MEDSTFIRFRDGMGARLIERAWNIDIRSLQNWKAFRSHVRLFNIDSNGAFLRQVRSAEEWLSCGERAVMLATLSVVGFEGLAEELNGGCAIEIEAAVSSTVRRSSW